jgi:methylenetetrahydrofolate dehydrogenase (NAD+)
MASNPAKGMLLLADPIAQTFRDEVKSSLSQLQKAPKLVGILSTASAPSQFYADFTAKQCIALGFEFELIKTGKALSSDLADGEGAEAAIIKANEDDMVQGIMVMPLFICHPSIADLDLR